MEEAPDEKVAWANKMRLLARPAQLRTSVAICGGAGVILTKIHKKV